MIFFLFTDWSPIWYLLYIVFSTSILTMERKRPEKTIVWIIILIVFPLFGISLYLLFGRNWKRRKNRLNIKTDDLTKELFNMYNTNLKLNKYKPLTNLFSNNSYSPLYGKNYINIFYDGEKLFNNIIEDIKKAKSHIHLEYYIFRDDKTGKAIIKELIKKAEKGIEVKIIADKMGSVDLKRKTIRKMRKSGIDFVFYSYVLAPILKVINTMINYRNHRKIIVIDGEIGYTGGFNIGDEYISSEEFGNWKDTHIRVTGDFVYGLQATFLDDFNRIKHIIKDKFFELQNLQKYFPEHTDDDLDIKMQLIKSGPDSDNPAIMEGIMKMISIAKNNIYITTPYFIPTDQILSALKIAIFSGIDVSILIPKKVDHKVVRWASMTYLEELIDIGGKVYLYDETNFLHSKSITIDGEICSVGSANMDIRSYLLNYELNAVIYDEEITKNIEDDFLNKVRKSEILNKYYFEKRSLITKYKESFARIFSNIM
ncbi:MAG: cardiolipin synthase [Thermotogota bacterium]